MSTLLLKLFKIMQILLLWEEKIALWIRVRRTDGSIDVWAAGAAGQQGSKVGSRAEKSSSYAAT